MGSRIAPALRDRVLNLRLTAEELQKAHDLANVDGLTLATLVRSFIVKTHRERFGAAPAASKPRAKGAK